MKIYIASSWKNQHGVQMLTERLREKNHEVISWIENNYEENHAPNAKFDFEAWVNGPESDKSFKFDTEGAMNCDLLIYYGNGGKDAAAECGMAYGRGVKMVALWSKGEDFGLMRKMFSGWFSTHTDLLHFVDLLFPQKNPYACYGSQRPHRMDFEDVEEFRRQVSLYDEWEAKNKHSAVAAGN
jgi:hypothetical protein